MHPSLVGRHISYRSVEPFLTHLTTPGLTAKDESLPDIVVVVLDSVSAWAVTKVLEDPRNGLSSSGKALLGQFVSFPRAVAVAPWSLPSHTSLLTGKYPWGEGGRWTDLADSKGPTTIPELLRQKGYRSLCLSANAFLSPHFGLTRGFDFVASGGPWESFIRIQSAKGYSVWERERPADPDASGPVDERNDSKLSQIVPRLGLRFPRFIRFVNHLLAKFTNTPPSKTVVSPWIEDVLRSQLAESDPKTPLFALVNLMDGHDPYLTPGVDHTGVSHWGIPQDPLFYMLRKVPAADPRVRALRSAYELAVRSALGRALEIVQIIRRTRGLDNSAVFITSDHGQAFMEDGILFHGLSVHDSVIRIPLFVHTPTSFHGRLASDFWVSLADIAPSIYDLLGISQRTDNGAGTSLFDHHSGVASAPVVAVSDGIHNRRAARLVLSEAMFNELDRVKFAAYQANWKATYSMSRQGKISPPTFSLEEGATAPGSPGGAVPVAVDATIHEIAKAYSDLNREKEDASVNNRLATWGY